MTAKDVKNKLNSFKWAKRNLEMLEKSFIAMDYNMIKSPKLEKVSLSKNISSDMISNHIANKIDIEGLIGIKTLELEKKFEEIENMISKISEREKFLIRNRYILCMNWEEVCDCMGYTYAHIHRIHDKAIQMILKDEIN